MRTIKKRNSFTPNTFNANPSVSNLSNDIAVKEELKHNPELERMAKEWIEAVLNEKLEDDFHESLKSGSILCRF